VAKATVARPAVTVVKRPTSRRAGSVRVTVRSTTAGRPTGTVRVQLAKGSSRRTYTVRLDSRGRATVKTSRLARGTWKVYVAYRGDAKFAPRAQARVANLKVTR
jgi:5-hydroxyisourate hydrolase-like protein (transthyretin family)